MKGVPVNYINSILNAKIFFDNHLNTPSSCSNVENCSIYSIYKVSFVIKNIKSVISNGERRYIKYER
jgi:hypothetical protein